MEFYLVDNHDNICGRTNSDNIDNAKHYFMGRKRIDEDGLNSVWRVMEAKQYNIQFKSNLQNRQVEWWKDDEDWLDIDK